MSSGVLGIAMASSWGLYPSSSLPSFSSQRLPEFADVPLTIRKPSWDGGSLVSKQQLNNEQKSLKMKKNEIAMKKEEENYRNLQVQRHSLIEMHGNA